MTGEARDPDADEGPLDGVTVVDCSQVLVGPFCTMQLGDLGADVIKVERPETGDQTRGWTPPTFGDDVSAYYASVNRNRRSMTLNLAREEGQAVLRELAADADVLVENFRVGAMEEWGLGYEDLRASNEGLVYCSLSGYGEWGPYADRPAYDLIVQAEAGLMSITGMEDGPPVRVGVAVADIGAGMYATQAILAALFEREIGDGIGQKIDVSLFDGQVAWMTYMAAAYFATGESPGRMGSKHPTIAPYQAFETRDGYVVVAVPSEKLWYRFCEAIDRPELVDDERFATNDARVRNRDALDAILEPLFRDRDTAAMVERLARHDVPAREVNDMEAVFEHPQVAARDMLQRVEHPDCGEIPMPASPMRFSRTPTSIRRYPPALGEHTWEILSELGYSSEAIERLEAGGIV